MYDITDNENSDHFDWPVPFFKNVPFVVYKGCIATFTYSIGDLRILLNVILKFQDCERSTCYNQLIYLFDLSSQLLSSKNKL